MCPVVCLQVSADAMAFGRAAAMEHRANGGEGHGLNLNPTPDFFEFLCLIFLGSFLSTGAQKLLLSLSSLSSTTSTGHFVGHCFVYLVHVQYISVYVLIFSLDSLFFLYFCSPFLSTDSWASGDGDENLCGYLLLSLAVVYLKIHSLG